MKKPLRIMVADDHDLFREGLIHLLQQYEEFEVVGDAADGRRAVSKALETRPDIVLMDVRMPECSGIDAAGALNAQLRGVAIVMLTVSEEEKDLYEAIKRGARGYLLKNVKSQQLHDYLLDVARGETPLSPAIAAKILRDVLDERQPTSQKETLSEREVEILELAAAGETNKTIGKALFISENTVRNHMQNILNKLHAKNRVQAVAYAVQKGLIHPSKEEEVSE